MTEKRCCGTCKHFQIDGMFGMWCDLGRDWKNVEYCSDWERRIRKGVTKMNYHTVKTLHDKLNELLERGYGDYEVCITYDNGYGVTFAHKEVEPKVKTSQAYGNKVIFAEDDKFVRGFK